jgi:hypothetical protein
VGQLHPRQQLRLPLPLLPMRNAARRRRKLRGKRQQRKLPRVAAMAVLLLQESGREQQRTLPILLTCARARALFSSLARRTHASNKPLLLRCFLFYCKACTPLSLSTTSTNHPHSPLFFPTLDRQLLVNEFSQTTKQEKTS